MKKNYIALLLLLMASPGLGCDICGCFMGITPYENQSNISLNYRMRSYNGYYYMNQDHNAFPSGSMRTSHGNPDPAPGIAAAPLTEKDYEEYRVIELRGKYFIHQRIELNVIVPCLMNTSEINQMKEQVSGLGDLNIIGGYHLLKTLQTGKWQHRLIAGAGLKLPTGSVKRRNKDEQRYHIMMQTGTGTTDYFLYLNYITAFRKLGASLNVSYKMNGENSYNESLANSMTSYLNLFYKFHAGADLTFIPSAQLYYEYSKGLRINSELQNGTSMNVAFLGPGIECFYKNISIHGTFQLPVYEKKETYRMGSSGKLVLGLTYSFNQRNYLLHKKTN